MTPERLSECELVVTDEELKQHLRIDDDLMWAHQSVIVRMYAAAAQEEAEKLTRRAIGMAEYRLVASGRRVEIPNPPVQSVELPVGQSVVLGHTVLEFDDDGPREINYRAGYTIAPPMLKAWILLRTASLYEHRSSDSAKPAQPNNFASELLVPYKARLILE